MLARAIRYCYPSFALRVPASRGVLLSVARTLAR